ncbi:unnamed protein product [Echinostoma caproni]|uniref:G_PROTEIN_RECEP_F1_2 domain-containing protein n=1 Tax=Echinostoma caproni TaxID=27848 RepID=A0A183B7U0_9TREM|nr:unnamed protein product [Echinostoma caproni]
MLLLVVLNTLVIRKLHRLGMIRFQSTNNLNSCLDSLTDVSERVGHVTHTVISVQMKIFLNAIILMIEITALEAVAITLFVLDFYGTVNFSENSLARLYYYVLVCLCDSFNPCVEVATIRCLRQTMLRHLHLCTSVCSGRMKTRHPSLSSSCQAE